MPAERIRELVSDKSMNIKEFFGDINISYRTIQNYLADKSSTDGIILTAILEKTGVSPNWLLLIIAPKYVSDLDVTGSDAHRSSTNPGEEFVKIPRFEVDASAGDGALVDVGMHSGFYAFNRSWLDRRNLTPESLAVISIRGDSMEPRLTDGDLILVDQSQKDIADGVTYVVRLGNDLLVKYVQRASPDAVSLLSENRRYPPREISLHSIGDRAAIIGRVVASMHEW
jgi:phage repressor protein C with HTH and peptisase S24 domain